MSEKITFQELIESIADQTNNSRQLTHDFLKDFVAVINSGLESDGTISIAGFGKFKLRPMDEREGYNPQTGEKITIPAHNKVVFKPYKGLRELVNAPYKHLEAELLDDETNEGDSRNTEEKNVSTSSSSSLSDWQEPEQPVEEEKQDQTPWEQSPKDIEDNTVDSSSSLDEETERNSQQNSPTEESDSEEWFSDNDIVEYSPDITKTNYEKYTSEGSSSENADKYDPDELRQMAASSYSYQRYRQRKKLFIKRIWLAAAACLALLLSSGAWYFSTSPDSATFALRNINFFKTSADTHQVYAPAAGQTNPSDSSSDMQIQSSEPPTGSDLNRESQKQVSTKQIITKGQTLWSLANQQYDNPYLWPWIYDENKSSIANPDLILAGQTLDLPLPGGLSGGLTTNDSLQVAIGYIETYRWYKSHGYSKAKYYLYAARMYNGNVFEYTDVNIDDSDLAFANRAR